MYTIDFISIKRFASFFKWFANISMKKWIKILVSISLGTFIFVMIISPGKPLADNSIYEAIFLIGAGAIASMVLSDINKPTIRQQFISIPATRFEKYYTVLSITIIRTIGLLLALCIADFFKTIIQCFQGEDFKMAIAVFDETNIGEITYFGSFTTFYVINYICGLTLRKHPYIFGILFGGIFSMTAILYAIKKLQNVMNIAKDFEYNSVSITTPFVVGFYTGLLLMIMFVFASIWFNDIQLSSKFQQRRSKL